LTYANSARKGEGRGSLKFCNRKGWRRRHVAHQRRNGGGGSGYGDGGWAALIIEAKVEEASLIFHLKAGRQASALPFLKLSSFLVGCGISLLGSAFANGEE